MKSKYPKDWKISKFSEVAKVVTGSTPLTSHPEYYGDFIPFIGPSELGYSIPITTSTKNLSELGSKKARILPRNSVLVCCIGTIGKVGFAGVDLVTNQQINSLIFDEKRVFPRYAFYYCQTIEQLIRDQGSSTTVPIISKSRFQELQIPYPAIEEQKRIAAILDKADRVRRKRQEAIRLTEELGRSIFLDMFGDPVTNPKGWEIKKLRSVIQSIDAGWSANGEEKKCEKDEWGVLKVSAVTSGKFKPFEHKSVGKTPKFSKSPIIPKKGDLLFSRANTRELVAATCIVEQDYERIFLSDKLWRISVLKDMITPEYLKFLLTYQRYRDLLTKQATGTSGSMLNISQGKLLDMNAPIPDINVQRKFSDLMWQSIKISTRIQENSKESEDLFNSLLQRAFRGEL